VLKYLKQHALNLLAAMGLIGFFLICVQEVSHDFAAGGLFGLVFLTSLIGFFIASLLNPSKHSGIFIYLLIAALASIPINTSIAKGKEVESITRGKQIVVALDTYYNRTGRYPEKLSDLVPLDLPQIPTTSMGFSGKTPFKYMAEENAMDFRLSFRCPFFLFCSYTSRQKKWILED
jgi:hypothetical protein